MSIVLHIVTGLGSGGAEGVLYRLAATDRQNTHHVISLTGTGVHGPRLTAMGIEVHAIDMRRGRVPAGGLLRLYRLIRRIDPDVIQTWMYHADLIGGCVARLAGKRAVVWGIRSAYLGATTSSASTRLLARVSGRLSSAVPSRIISCSTAAARTHSDIGYDRDKIVVIHNGYDIDRLSPDAEARARTRMAWEVPQDAVLLGMVARWDVLKDHATLIAALGELRRRAPLEWRCVLVGSGMTDENRELLALLERHGVRDRVLLAGQCSDMAAVMNALDLHVLSSIAEAFPNVVAEAMACGTPCVVTDVGDARLIVGDTGWVAAPSDAVALADAVGRALEELEVPSRRKERSAAARARIVELFALDRMVQAYRSVWASCLSGVNGTDQTSLEPAPRTLVGSVGSTESVD